MTHRPKTTLRDCIYGLAVGDALGVPYEFRPRGTFECTDMIGYGTHGQPAGTWSDDTSMTLATCDSIRELGHIDTADMRDKFVSWIARGEYTIDGVFDYGGTTARALHAGKGSSGECDNGNGSLMRIAPPGVHRCDRRRGQRGLRDYARPQNVNRVMHHICRTDEGCDERRAPLVGTSSERRSRAGNQVRWFRPRHA